MIKLYINLPYMRYAEEQLIRSCIKKLKISIRKEVQVKFVVTYNTTKLSFFTNSKDRITKLAYSNMFYHFFSRMSPRLHWKNRENTLGKDKWTWLPWQGQLDIQPYYLFQRDELSSGSVKH